MKNRSGLNYKYGVIASALAILFLLYGGYILIPLFGEKGALLAGIPIALMGVVLTFISGTSFKEVLPFRLPPVKSFFGALMLHIGVTSASACVTVILGLFTNPNARDEGITSILSGMSPLASVILVALIPAVCEEFFCRGFLVRCFKQIKNEKLIILIVAVIFGAMHLDLLSFVQTAAFGAVMCYVAIKTESLLIPMIIHFANNAYSLISSYAQNEASQAGELVNKLYPIQAVALVILYSGIAIAAIYVGIRLLSGKRLFTIKLLIPAILAFVMVVGGYGLFVIGSIKPIANEVKTIGYEQGLSDVTELQLNEAGNYIVSVSVVSSKKIDVIIALDGKNIVKKSGSGMITFACPIEYTEGTCQLILNTDEGDSIDKSSEITVRYIVMRINA